ncbi:Uncharacterized protein DAT39_016747 [Clarias magur]|uniref:Uncharacterized protein n=1 Tax=Clarias magur TaxID=1594786 RepID=A0A8J4U9M2_CLAMG|nr:Uncharacterized protein DAT39_016747 [Clarias magur]
MCRHAARGGNPDLDAVTDCLLWVHLVAITLERVMLIATVTASELFTHTYNHTRRLPRLGSAQLGSMWRAEARRNPLIHTIAFSEPGAANDQMYSALSLPENCLVPIKHNPLVLTDYTSGVPCQIVRTGKSPHHRRFGSLLGSR